MTRAAKSPIHAIVEAVTTGGHYRPVGTGRWRKDVGDAAVQVRVVRDSKWRGLHKEVRQKQPSLKVIFISGYAEDNFRRRLDMDSDIHFLPKPFSLKQLAGKVKEVMREGSA